VLPPAAGDAPLSGDEMDFLERVLRECHLGDEGHSRFQQPPQPPPEVQRPQARVMSDALTLEAMAPWADEMVGTLQGCASPEEARARCAQMLTSFAADQRQRGAAASAQAASAQAERLRVLQGANHVLLRGFRSLHIKGREAEAKRQRAEEVCASMAAELQRCQEQVHGLERAKSALQYHLQVLGTKPLAAAAGGM